MTVLTVSGLLAETIMNVFSDDSVSAIFGGENQLFWRARRRRRRRLPRRRAAALARRAAR